MVNIPIRNENKYQTPIPITGHFASPRLTSNPCRRRRRISPRRPLPVRIVRNGAAAGPFRNAGKSARRHHSLAGSPGIGPPPSLADGRHRRARGHHACGCRDGRQTIFRSGSLPVSFSCGWSNEKACSR
ncbi:hypothetical protein CV_1049 [Chromobacterium violaceum ATCC 12472]|uniref:Uncharacterized protein n=1 Tax=Chromobacterium violaceum (strain ATCC 12472 / DSM 30191 / JCM 1249 / CCUG 213 / NBRC 12614 / NCIMB 9131 / NCTC 9757 / MK) TaxID=243365 RepID=Q7NZ73_CHRVO|nr:hypothetical protein CV_1049 [Chromobacterium violaceum ATCC 12472]